MHLLPVLVVVAIVAVLALASKKAADKLFPSVEHEGYGAVLAVSSWKDDLPLEECDGYYWGVEPPVIPTGSIAAAIASRWRSLRWGETPANRADEFALASGGSFHSRH